MLEERIMNAIEKEAMKTGKMGTESVDVTINLTPAEQEEFMNLTAFDNDHWTWFIEGDTLEISYTEEI